MIVVVRAARRPTVSAWLYAFQLSEKALDHAGILVAHTGFRMTDKRLSTQAWTCNDVPSGSACIGPSSGHS